MANHGGPPIIWRYGRAFLMAVGNSSLMEASLGNRPLVATCIPQRPEGGNRPMLVMFSLSFFELHSSPSDMFTQLFSGSYRLYKMLAAACTKLIKLRSSVFSRSLPAGHLPPVTLLTNFRHSFSTSLVNRISFYQQCVILSSPLSRP